MFVSLGGLRGNTISAGLNYQLLGIVSGYFFESADFHLEIASTVSGTQDANSGISVVVPVDELKSLLDVPALKARRAAEIPPQPSK